MHGTVDESGTDLMSDLPILMAKYEPGMILDSIIGYQDDRSDGYFGIENVLTALQANLKNPVTSKKL